MLAALAAAATLFVQSPSDAGPPVEVRGVWIPNSHSTFFESRENVRDQMQILADAGINVVFPVVWSKGRTLFDSAVAENVVGVRKDPRYGDRDPLAEVLFEAHRHGIEVIPWFEYGFAAGHETFPGKAVENNPGWAAIGADGQPVIKNGFEWMNALDPDVQTFMSSLVVECATKYDVDGVQGDDRLPALPAEAGYDAKTVGEYRKAFGVDPPEDIHDARWTQWRADRLTDYLDELRGDVKKVSSDLVFSMAPGAPSWSLRDYLQDQKTWVERRLVDALHPQLYARDLDGYVKSADATLGIDWLGKRRAVISPGVLASFRDYVISKEMALGAVAANRERGLAGEIWFYEKGLIANDGAIAAALGVGPYRERARLPWRRTVNWRPRELVGNPTDVDGVRTWTVVPPADGVYQIWVEEAPGDPSDERTHVAAPGSGWRLLGMKRLGAGTKNELLRAPVEDTKPVRSVRAIIDRKADRH